MMVNNENICKYCHSNCLACSKPGNQFKCLICANASYFINSTNLSGGNCVLSPLCAMGFINIINLYSCVAALKKEDNEAEKKN